jgi:hypothetical protein
VEHLPQTFRWDQAWGRAHSAASIPIISFFGGKVKHGIVQAFQRRHKMASGWIVPVDGHARLAAGSVHMRNKSEIRISKNAKPIQNPTETQIQDGNGRLVMASFGFSLDFWFLLNLFRISKIGFRIYAASVSFLVKEESEQCRKP